MPGVNSTFSSNNTDLDVNYRGNISIYSILNKTIDGVKTPISFKKLDDIPNPDKSIYRFGEIIVVNNKLDNLFVLQSNSPNYYITDVSFSEKLSVLNDTTY